MSKPPETRRALGKGLSALIPQRPPAPLSSPAPAEPHEPPTDPARNRPRSAPSRTSILTHSNLARSSIKGGLKSSPNPIRSQTAFIQPLIVRHHGDRFQMVAGERRLRAARVAGLTQVPWLSQDFADRPASAARPHREHPARGPHPIETAQAVERLANDLNLTHEEIAHRTGKDRTSITNLIRLLRLPGTDPASACRAPPAHGTRPGHPGCSE